MHFEVLRAQNGLYFWRIKGGNGEIMAVSETYYAKASALHAIGVVKANAATAPVYDRT